jgi:hydrogenase maturation protein HypF
LQTDKTIRRRLGVTGQVQGVGFRPFVYRLAGGMKLTGWVANDSVGLAIEIQGLAPALDEFSLRLRNELPPLARIVHLTQEDIPIQAGLAGFEIRTSQGGEFTDAQVTVDSAVCGDCLAEMRDPADRRYDYPFISCTNCGPRYTIITAIPYDRANTTMADFPMCPLCRREYDDPLSRRFHAQPIACRACGPGVYLVDSQGAAVPACDAIAHAAALLAQGKILAIKGIGGFHLACCADDEHAVMRLRRRKLRDAKPFALMVADLKLAGRICQVAPDAAELLSGPARPIVILPACQGQSEMEKVHIAAGVAQGLSTLGIMLPYTPLQHLLFGQPAIAGRPIVMTSGNYSCEPLVKDNDSAVAALGQIADYLLLHNMRIHRRLDDSVVQPSGDGRLISLRRSRGYAPQPIQLAGLNLPNLASQAGSAAKHAILAVGGELKSTVCLLKGDRAVLSEHIGDLKDGRVYRHYIDTINHLEKLFAVKADILAADLHPQYLSTQYAAKRSAGRPVVRVQHHHAHIAACLAENGYAGPAIGLACDGVGYGDDGAVWGCEILKADLANYDRLGHLRYIPLPGGDAAANQTHRPALAALFDAFGPGPELESAIGQCRLSAGLEQVRMVCHQLEHDVNCPPCSSLGRWFDAIAGLSGVAGANDFEGQAPMLLEGCCEIDIQDCYDFGIVDSQAGGFVIDPRPMVRQIVGDLAHGRQAGLVAAKFHNTVAEFLLAGARLARQKTQLAVVAMSGGCFANRYLSARLVAMLEQDGFAVLRHQTIPCNDGCVALGQAVVAASVLAGSDK